MTALINPQDFSSEINNNIDLTVVNGSISGTIEWAMPFQGSSFKQIIIHCSALVGTVSIVFPIPFINDPMVVTPGSTGGAAVTVITALTTTGLTCTGASDDGILIIEGF